MQDMGSSNKKKFQPVSEKFKSHKELLAAAVRGWEGALKLDGLSYLIPQSDVVGQVPSELEGTFFRNGPGLNEVYGVPLKHPIDGDGMICALTFKNGRVHFRSRFVQTWQHQMEVAQRAFLFRGQMGTTTTALSRGEAWKVAKSIATGAASKPNLNAFRDPSNTNVFYWGGKLLSCYETCLPHSIDPYTLNTLGPDNLNGTLPIKAFAAHFRVDPIKNTIHTLSLKPESPALANGKAVVPPVLIMNEYDVNWKLIQSLKLNIPGLNYAHDFLLTPNYYILHISPFVKIDQAIFFKIVLGLSSPGDSMKHFPELPSQFIVIPRKTSSFSPTQYQLFDTGRFHIYHFGNASEVVDCETGEVKIDFNALCLGEKFTMEFDQGIWLSNGSVQPGYVLEFSLRFSKLGDQAQQSNYPRDCESRVADTNSSEFPVSHPWRHGLPSRYLYLMSSTDLANPIPFTDIVKYDALGNNGNGKNYVWKSHGIIGEPCFVPRSRKKSSNLSETEIHQRIPDEDDGWVIAQVYVAESHRTDFVILDARNVDNGPVAIIQLQHHIPYGFHGTWADRVFYNDFPETLCTSRL